MKKYKLKIKNLDCANCANNLEKSLEKINIINNVNVNFMTESITWNCKKEEKEEALKKIKAMIKKVEPEVKIEENLENKNKEIIKIFLSIFISGFSIFLKDYPYAKFTLLMVAYFIVGASVLKKSWKNIKKGKMLDENFLMSIATIGAIFLKEYEEAVAVMLFYKIGEFLESYAVNNSRKSISDLMNIRPDYAYIYKDNKWITTSLEEVKKGDIILVKPGEKIPLDGVVIEGETYLDTMVLTGESLPKKVSIKDNVLSGCINKDGIIKIKVEKEYKDSTVSKILDLVENASNKKSKSENFISKFSRIYTPVVVIIALIIAILPPLFLKDATFYEWIYRALSFLVVSCPCALVISVPLTFFGGIGRASKMGVLIKGSNYLEALSKIDIVVFDKTGTLTEGVFKVCKIKTIDISEQELLEYAAHSEGFSNHPIALSIKEAYQKEIDESLITKTKEIPGKGIKATVKGKEVLIGNEKLMQDYKIKYQKEEEIGTLLYIAIDEVLKGTILIKDKIKKDAYKSMKELKKNNVKKIVMLTGDKEEISKEVAEKLKIDEFFAELLPQNKVEKVEKLMKEKSLDKKLIFVGDGVNDAPVLALSDIGISMGGLGSDAAIEASDVVIMTDEPSLISETINLSKRTMKIVKQNIVFAITIKIGVLSLSAFGLTSMWIAVFADVGVSVLAILNSLRILKK